MKKIFPLLLTLLIFSCSSAKLESPMIYFSNSSPAPISNIRCKWASGNVLSLDKLNPGESRSLSFYIKNTSKFFGLISVSWLNDSGEMISREFFFRKKHMPSIDDKENFNYVQFYLDQQGLDIVNSDEADLGNKIKRMDDLMVAYRKEYSKNHTVSMDTLLIVDRPKENEVPYWQNMGMQ